MERLKLSIAVFILLLPSLSLAAPYYGATLSYTAVAKEPPYLHGYQFMFNYDPDCYKWRQFNLYFDAGFSHFWITNTSYYTTLNIYSAAPVIRYTFKKRGLVHPYLDLSIGLAYFNHTHLDNRNLGIHFAFQDRIGLGVFLGQAKQFSVGIHAVHYSNAHLSDHNSGISIPLALDISYRFG
ncbi:Lipid A deacylase PagL [Aquicella siphonis]|uniref:Lipid A deacylase PagL n=1 Tax=Aquicella siphonis TaxID=254247 RepID=A0A5E4PH43_9COXI|nr:acyloxyacyl hydrolase [Aquicella siphonis]VVC76214.1 Lipid A deacylase PagL [Aquicella siphonis]